MNYEEIEKLCKGYSKILTEGSQWVERLYAVLPDGRVFRSEEINMQNLCPTPYFDTNGRVWDFMPTMTLRDVEYDCKGRFCGKYKIPASIKKIHYK
ncbi:hypothetical protein PSI19_18650 [Xenorhabdus khoisanae]|uniref:hypothetical protein n=1 Tax=Xenorhabdus khoisanae TaxID=880157 RepID=UPI00235845E2|nr:hypothetical protein [Xenorhabdus khoisanae]MDC9615851.1 hypothetical protein [Xenorhabdus khoisanae]